jgi:hypothetical protein
MVRVFSTLRWPLSKLTELEKRTERNVAEYARDKGCMALKLTILGQVGWPDYLFLYPIRRVLFIEFKRVGEKPRAVQFYIHEKLRRFGFRVEVVDDVVVGKNLIDQLTGVTYEY